MRTSAAVQRRWLVLAMLGGAVLGGHVAALSLLGPRAIPPGPPMQTAASLQAPRIVLLALPATGAAVGTAAPTARSPAPAAPPAAAPVSLAPATTASAARVAATAVAAGPATPPPVAAATAAEPAAPLATAADGAAVPVYATRLPPAGRWRYRLQRGAVVGTAELQWAPELDGRYQLRLLGLAAGAALLEWASQGAVDAAGVAPERFALRRRGRDVQAANFQRDAGMITFSGPTHAAPLPAGAQDRLSWLVQLPAIVDAAPERFGGGAQVVLWVAGARGDTDRWIFEVQGIETAGASPLLKLVREPRRLYDTRVEVWLDPADHHKPVRIVQTPSGGGPPLELQLERDSR